jgi:hypothetical protein
VTKRGTNTLSYIRKVNVKISYKFIGVLKVCVIRSSRTEIQGFSALNILKYHRLKSEIIDYPAFSSCKLAELRVLKNELTLNLIAVGLHILRIRLVPWNELFFLCTLFYNISDLSKCIHDFRCHGDKWWFAADISLNVYGRAWCIIRRRCWIFPTVLLTRQREWSYRDLFFLTGPDVKDPFIPYTR